MKIQDSVQCHACNSILSHPVDACPVCGDQFYWLVTTKNKPTQNEKEGYLVRMEELVEGRASREFLNHDGHLWLPYRFWDSNPNGEILDSFTWIDGVQLFQHESEINNVPVRDYDTLPKIPIPEWVRDGPSALDKKKTIPKEPRKQEQPLKPAPVSEPVNDSYLAGPIIPAQMFLPLMVFLFLIFLSFSYLTLRYHKNHRWPSSQAVPEESHESSVLP